MGYKVPITLIFFNRPDTLEAVFAQVRNVRPEQLFLVQDGARDNRPDDAENILRCRQIVEQIDWDCEVHRNYSEVNLGCGVRPQSGITWVLSQVDRTIILEDDCVPNPTFFPYCEEMLTKYEHDERIVYISGLNHFEQWDFGGNSYGFTKGGAIWGWATWKRAWDRYDYDLRGIQNEYLVKLMEAGCVDGGVRIPAWKRTFDARAAGQNISYWDAQWGFVKYSQSQMVIVPKYNLISNIGVGATSTHAHNTSNVHKKYLDYNNMPTKSLEFPLVHPDFVFCDTFYDDLLFRCNKQINRRLFFANLLKRLGLKKH